MTWGAAACSRGAQVVQAAARTRLDLPEYAPFFGSGEFGPPVALQLGAGPPASLPGGPPMLRTQTSLLAVTLTVALGPIASASPTGPTTGPGTEIEPNVVGGQPAPAGKWPDVAALI